MKPSIPWALYAATLLLSVTNTSVAQYAAENGSTLNNIFSMPNLCSMMNDSQSTDPHILKPIPISDNWDLQFGANVETRVAHRTNFLMQHPVDGPTHDTPFYLYARLNAELRNKSKDLTMFVEGITVQTGNYVIQWNPYEDIELDLFQAWLEYKVPNSPWSVKIGRQLAPDLGDGRIISGPCHYWKYFSQDGITVRRITPATETTLMAYSVNTFVGNDTGLPYASELRPANYMIWGIYNTWNFPNKTRFDLYNINKHSFNKAPYVDGSTSTADRLQNYGFGSRLRGPLYTKKDVGTWTYGIEGMIQVGRYGAGQLLAHMLHADTSWQWDCAWKPKVTLIGNIASGNRDPYSNRWNRFDSLLGPSHYSYGLANNVKLCNMNELALSFEVNPNEKTKVITSAHQFWLNSASDAWIAAGPGTVAWDKDGKHGNDLGRELDLEIRHKVNAHWTIEFGAAYFFTGDYGAGMGHGANSSVVYLNQIFSF